MRTKVSVIIPVFNSEKYIAQCIEALINQTLEQCEFIFVNDGSNDKSKNIIENYCKKDKRIILINQENQGVSTARNSGLDIASGDYVGFVDSDDFVERDMYSFLYEKVMENDCDVILCNFQSDNEERTTTTRYPFRVNEKLDSDYIEEELLPYFLKADNCNTVCNKLYKNKLITEQNIRFPVGVPLGEDGMFNMIYFSHARSARYIDYTGYHYRDVLGSATKNILEKDYFQRAEEVYLAKLPEIVTEKYNETKIKEYKSHKLIRNVMSFIHLYFYSTQELTFRKRYNYVKRMVNSEHVKEALSMQYHSLYKTVGRYERFLLDMIKRKSIAGLYCVTAYSRFRNKYGG
ncbi:glycosyltransferase [Pseudalkalibacillus caeni]|uniref:Glycosyltransferase n=1 Tax=Exobacillus caeni TaxID=2574798 RepID=A0A5R9EWY2_9BACL|nr:glycosyltransferase [Pseudalkalibacillus caeni]TLS35772.1 glycosyltransferase [Pseudalkalibacillus caeni]